MIVVVAALRTFENKTEPLTAPVLAWVAVTILKGRCAVLRKQREKTIQKNMIRNCGCLGPESVRTRQLVEKNMIITLSWAT